MGDAQVKAEIDGMTPEKRIEYIQSSPLPPDEKKRRIEEIRRENPNLAAPDASSIPGR